jgi:hypothetical protein
MMTTTRNRPELSKFLPRVQKVVVIVVLPCLVVVPYIGPYLFPYAKNLRVDILLPRLVIRCASREQGA